MGKAIKKFGYQPDYAVFPGETLKDAIAALQMTQRELAMRTGLTVQSINRIIKGDQPITYATANKLELATGVPAEMWNKLEAHFRERQAKLAEKKELSRELDWLKTIPVSELVERGYLEGVEDREELLRGVLRFYGVSSVGAWKEYWETPQGIAARRSACFETKPGAASAWIRMGFIKAIEVECKPYSDDEFKSALAAIRKLTEQTPVDFIPRMERLCAGAGVAFVLVPELKKVPWNGATMWLTPDKAIIIMNIRGKAEDRFWFSFLHEARHVLKDKRKDLYINDGRATEEIERKAEEFAAEFLIPKKFNPTIAAFRTNAEVVEFARKLGISPGIVAGRYQFLTKRWDKFRSLIKKFEWSDD